MTIYLVRNLVKLTWLTAVFCIAFVGAPKLFPACNTASCNFGSQTSEYCYNSGACEYPDYCKMATCQASTCSPPQNGYINYCVHYSYCNAFPNCNSGCGGPLTGC